MFKEIYLLFKYDSTVTYFNEGLEPSERITPRVFESVYSGTYKGIFAENDVIVTTTTEGIYSSGTDDTVTPTVVLSDTDSDNIVSNSDVVTITATFSESMAATPTLSLSGITSNALMSATATA